MSTTQDNEAKATQPRPQQPIAPDGKSDLPVQLPDYPPPTSGGGGDSGPSTTK